jgi:hypothetical protein
MADNALEKREGRENTLESSGVDDIYSHYKAGGTFDLETLDGRYKFLLCQWMDARRKLDILLKKNEALLREEQYLIDNLKHADVRLQPGKKDGVEGG